MVFRLQQLPSLALDEIAKSMELCDILLLTQTSFRMKRMVRRVTKKISVHLDIIDTKNQKSVVCHRWNPRIQIIELPIISFFTVSCRPQAKFGRVKAVWSIGGLQNTFEKGYPDAFKAIIDTFVEVADLKSVSLRIRDTKGKDSIKILEHVRMQDVTIENVDWRVECCHDIGNQVVKACVDVKEKLVITAPWISIDQVLSLRNVPELVLQNTYLTNEDLNTVIHGCSDIKKWTIWVWGVLKPEIVLKNLEINRRWRRQRVYRIALANGRAGYVDFNQFSIEFSTAQEQNRQEVQQPRRNWAWRVEEV